MWKSFSSALERTGEAITKAVPQGTVTDDELPLAQRLSQGWGSVVEATKQAVDATREAVEKEQTRFFNTSIKRDPRLPLDMEALRDAEVVYITERIITLGHPALQSSVDDRITPHRKLAAVAHMLNRRHGGKFMVWNLSEVEYDVSILDDQVLTFSFPGSPSPPLGLLLKLLMSMESWLKADERNVAVVHCLTGKGRTATVVAAFLCWVGEAGFHNVQQALTYVATCKKLSLEQLTIPSQRRYVQYFTNMLDGVRPSQPPLMLKRVLLSEAPKFAKGPPKEDGAAADDSVVVDDSDLMGCAPYIQIFKAGELQFTAAASINYQQAKDELPFCYSVDGSISFQVEHVLQGDILIRGRHLTASGQRVSMFRAAFHTGYVPPQVMRLSKEQLDGACTDRRFPNDFFMDLIFEPCNAEMASQHLLKKAEKEAAQEHSTNMHNDGVAAAPPIVTACAYDSMLHRDSRFWDVISQRRQEHVVHQKEEEDPMWGPTIGRKRDLSSRGGSGGDKKKTTGQDGKPSLDPFSAFSIVGDDFDFFDTPAEGKSSPTTRKKESETAASAAAPPPKRDELMEALMALDDDPTFPPNNTRPVMMPASDVEEIVFFKVAKPPLSTTKEPQPTIVALPPKQETAPPPSSEQPTDEETKASENETTTEKKEMTPSAVDEAAAALLNDADLDMDVELDALLTTAGAADGGANVDYSKDMGDDDDDDIDLFDDDDLEDLENLLSRAKK